MPALSPPPLLRNLLPTILLLSLLYTTLATGTEPYTLNPNNVICSPSFFGSPTPADCTSALSTLATDEAVQRFLFITDQEQGAYQALPLSNTVGNCTLDVNIRPGARNNVSWKTLSDIANAIPTTCAEGGGGGWGIFGIPPIPLLVLAFPYSYISSTTFLPFSSAFLRLLTLRFAYYHHMELTMMKADIYILLSSTSSTAYTMNPANQPKIEWSDEPPAEEAEGATGEGELKADPHAYFRGSFWGSGIGQINITDLPGYPDLASIPFPFSAYTGYTPAEKAYCPAAPPTCQEDTECCERANCVNRVLDGNVQKVCVPYSGVDNKGSTVSTEGDTVVIEANGRRRRSV
ncbi:MAG: hypothetical protein Q9192_007968 [Flavoplaca navasiana]